MKKHKQSVRIIWAKKPFKGAILILPEKLKPKAKELKGTVGK